MIEPHPEVVSEDGSWGIAADGELLRVVIYHPRQGLVPELHWVPARILERTPHHGR